MRILHVLDHSLPLHSGYGFRTRAIMKAQQAKGWEVAGLTGARQGGDPLPKETVEGLTFFRTPRPSIGVPLVGELLEIAALRRRLGEVIGEWRPDQIHVHSPVLNALAALPVAKRRGVPAIYEIRAFWEDAAVANGTGSEGSPRYRLTQWLETRAARSADAVAVICEGLRADIVARGIPADKVIVSPNGVDLDLFGEAPVADPGVVLTHGLQGCEIIGFVGSFYDYEGIDDLIAAMPRLAMRRPKAKLLLVGGGPMDQALRAQAAESPAADRIAFVGRVPHDEVEKYYGLIDILAYPRKAMRLTELVTPLKPLEAMAQRRLVAASNVGGHRELIENGVTGTLFAPGDPAALADALAAMLADRGDWEARREAGRAFVERERDWASNISRYDPIYRALTGAPAARTTTMTAAKTHTMTRPTMRHWLVKASAAPFELPMGVALGLSLGFALTVMPEPLFEGYFAATGLPMLGLLGRVTAALGFGALGGWGTWRALLAAGKKDEKSWQLELPKGSFTPRRADAHPDTPTRRPIFAESELGPPMDSVEASTRRRNPVPAGLPKPEIHLYPTPSGQPAAETALPAPHQFAAPEPITETAGESAEETVDETVDETEFLLDTPFIEDAPAAEVAPRPVAAPLVEDAPWAAEASLPPAEVPPPLAEAPVSPIAAEMSPVEAPVSPVAEDVPSDRAYRVDRAQPSEQESIAALMLRLEQGLAGRPAPQPTRAGPAWLVPEDGAPEQRSAGRR